MSEAVKYSSGETPAAVPQVSPIIDHPHLARMRKAKAEESKRHGGGGGGNMSDLERRIGILETDVRAIRDNLSTLVTDTAVIKSNYASKIDIADLQTELKTDISSIRADIASANLVHTRWMIGILLAAIGLVFAIQRYSPPQNSPAPSQAQTLSNQIPTNTSPPVQQRKP